MYAATFPTHAFEEDSILPGKWHSSVVSNSIVSYAHLKGSSVIAI